MNIKHKKYIKFFLVLLTLSLITLIGILHTIVIPGGSILDEACCADAQPGSDLYVKCQEMSAVETFVEKCFGIE